MMYIPLYVKSNYSLLSSVLTIDDIVAYSKTNHLPSCVINDTTMYGTMELIQKCEKENIKPIISLALVYRDLEFVIFARNYQGYQSMIKLSTIKSKRQLELADLTTYNQGILTVIPFQSLELYEELNSIYFHLYLGYSSLDEEKKAKEIDSRIVFFKESLYLNQEDWELLQYLYLIRDSKTVHDDFHYDLFHHELIQNNPSSLSSVEGLSKTFEIVNQCNVEFPKVQSLLPIYKDTKNMNPRDYLFELSKAGLLKRLQGNLSNEYKERLSYELKVIDKMGFCNYFLVVYDFIRFAKKNGILVGPGRGSAAGSLVSYALGITDIDPLKYQLLFERFLNPERITMPDIDTDFPDDKREEVIKYVTDKYGAKNVSGIITFGTLGIKQVIRDVSRVMGIPLYKVDALSKFIPNFSHEKLVDFYHRNEVFKTRIDSDQDLTKMFYIASKIEGFPRHTSSHAAGIIMSEIALDEVIPLTYSDGMYLSSYSMEYLEDLGLLKMDFLGLKNLSLIHHILLDIQKNYHEHIDFSTIPLNDPESINIFTTANTLGIFQFESTGMKQFLKKLKPDCLEDIFAAIALFRPGPAGNIDSYIKRKRKEEKITYLDPCLEDILKNTYGILIYQEQIIQVANVYAGYTLGEADVLRRAMSKKKVDLLKSEEDRFIKKSLEKGRALNTAKQIFQLILNFAGYGFNRSHSVAYSLIAYKMAYLKVHYQQEFFANLLTNVIGSEYKTKEYIEEVKSCNIIVEKPNINLSSDRYIVHEERIIYPFSNLKSVGSVSAKQILKARTTPFVDIYDAFSRLVIEKVTAKTIECLIYSDAFSLFGYNKRTLIENLDSLMNYAELTKDIDPSLVMKPDIEKYQEYDDSYLLEQEYKVFGFYLSHHPTTTYYKDNQDCIRVNNLKQYFNQMISILVLVERVKVINTKRGEKMSFVIGDDETAKVDLTLFPKIYKMYSNLSRGDIIKVTGRVERRLDEWQVIVSKIDILNGEEK